ncbi:MAG: N-formylglutamate amidohydrolase [Patescibacteria group bacterium]
MAKKLALIISAPHACSTVPQKWRKRMLLNERQIWHFSDPFTQLTARHPRAWSVHVAKTHRALGDLNRLPTPETAFRKYDFHGKNKVWKEGLEPNNFEKAELLQKNWFPYYEEIFESLRKLIAQGAKKILFIDHHNTASDHPAGDGREYMPAIVISNFGSKHRAARVKSRGEISLPASAMTFLRKTLWEELELGGEINQIYHGGYAVKWVMENAKLIDPSVKIYGLQFEYNLGLIHNPLSQKNDLIALDLLRKKVNRAITRLAEYLKCDEC